MDHKIALIIPTRNRLKLLSILLRSISTQTVMPDQIIIVDGSDQSMEEQLRMNSNISFDYIWVNPPSLTAQRNKGIELLKNIVDLVAYLDDDLVLESDSIEKMLKFWEKATPEVAGAQFNITNNEISQPNLFSRIFGIRSKKRGVILKGGGYTVVIPQKEKTRSEWLCGGATVWRREIFNEFRYDEWFKGAAYYEDMDFSYQVSKKYKLYVLRDAKVQHNPPPFIPKRCIPLGEMNITYRHYFVKKYFNKTFPHFHWTTIGFILRDSVNFIIKKQINYLYLVIGYLLGCYKLLVGCSGGIHTEFRGKN